MDRDSVTPPYQQIAAEIESDIESGRLPPGARLPSLTDIMGRYDVGKGTAVRALGVLKDRGLAETRQGWGTFVVPDISDRQ